MFQGKGLQKPEYPRDLTTLYGWAEDGLFELFNAVEDGDFSRARESAGDVIVLMSEIVECAERAETLSGPDTEEE